MHGILNRKWAILVCTLFGAALSFRAVAITANPLPFEVKQPNGKAVILRMRGDEYFHWQEDLKGYTVVRSNKGYVYATLDTKGGLSPTPWLAGETDPAGLGLRPGILPAASIREESRKSATAVTPPRDKSTEPSGTVKNLVVLCMFSDHTVENNARPSADYDVLFNSLGGDPALAPTGSVREYYFEASYGALTMESTVVGWVTLPHEEAYYGASNDGMGGTFPNNGAGMVRDALDLADPLVDFSEFDENEDGYIDAITVIHSGYAAETGGGDGNWIWSHKSSLWAVSGSGWSSAEGVKVFDYHTEAALWNTFGTEITHLGVICHETGHFFGLPDLYDTDSTPGDGIGSWGLMANSWGFDFSQLHPPHFCGWSKIRLGWVTPTVLNTPGVYAINQLETEPEVFRVNNNFPANEYLLIENRQPAGFESDMPQGGLVIYHIDDAAGYNTQGYPGQEGWPENGKHYRVAVLQADSEYNLEKGDNRGDAGDPYHEYGVSAITSATVPNTDAYQVGSVYPTDIEIEDVGPAGENMSFHFGLGDDVSYAPRENFVAGGPLGGPFEAQTKTYALSNSNSDAAVHWSITVEHESAWLTVAQTSGTIEPAGSVGVDLSIDSAAASGLASGVYTDTVTFHNPDTGWSRSIQAMLTVAVHWFPLEIDPGWQTEGLWAFGTPQGLGGQHGYPDPASAFSGVNVYGYNLGGDYPNGLAGPQYLTTLPINCRAYQNLQLQFRAWLGVEKPDYDHAALQVSPDGVHWSTLWQNTGEMISGRWQLMQFDISSVADNRSSVYLRWSMGPTDRTWPYCGWNIDDVAILGELGGGEGAEEGEIEGLPEGEGMEEGEGELDPITVNFCSAFHKVVTNKLLNYLGTEYRYLIDMLQPDAADINGSFDIDIGGPISIAVNGNGIKDAANELGLLARILADSSFDNGVLSYAQVRHAWDQNWAQLINKNIGTPLSTLLPGMVPGLAEILVGYVTIGDGDLISVSETTAQGTGSFGIIAGIFALTGGVIGQAGFGEFAYPYLDKTDFIILEKLALNEDADGDGYSNLEEYAYFTPVECAKAADGEFGSPVDYVTAALNPNIYPGGEGFPEGEGATEGMLEGEGVPDGEGGAEGLSEGEGLTEGVIEEGSPEGFAEGEGIAEGQPEGIPEGEGGNDGEGTIEGQEEGGEPAVHTADQNADGKIALVELLRVIQFFNSGGYQCAARPADTEDGYRPGTGENHLCAPHASDYNPLDWQISLTELLRLIQFFNSGGYHACPGGNTEDGFCPGLE